MKPEQGTERVDLAAAFRWTVQINMHETVANPLLLSVSADGTWVLSNPNGWHFAPIRARDLVEIDARSPGAMARPDAPDRPGECTARSTGPARTRSA